MSIVLNVYAALGIRAYLQLLTASLATLENTFLMHVGGKQLKYSVAIPVLFASFPSSPLF